MSFLGPFKCRYVIALMLLTCVSTVTADKGMGVLKNIQNGSFRAIHVVVRKVTSSDVERIANIAVDSGFNTIILQLSTDTIPLKAIKKIPVTTYRWKDNELKQLVDRLYEKGLWVIPEIKLLTHQEKFLARSYPEYMYNSSTYNPRSTELLKKIVFPVIDEIISLTRSDLIHIGHDEVAGHSVKSRNKWLLESEEMLPANDYLHHLEIVGDYLESKGIKAMIWGDMLLSQSEFDGMARQHLHGNSVGYGKSARTKIPKGIVIADWHYVDKQKEYPSLKTFVNEGFLAVGTVWRQKRSAKNFISYAEHVQAGGMIVSTWTDFVLGRWRKTIEYVSELGRFLNRKFPDEE